MRRLGQALWCIAAPLGLAIGCRHEPGAAIVVEADTTAVQAGGTRPVVEPQPVSRVPEVIVIEERASDPPGEAAADAPPAPTMGPEGRADSVQTEPEVAAEPILPAPNVLPVGTRLALELRTPLHSGTIRVGDRFAARTVESIVVEESELLGRGALIEGRIAGVVRAGEAGDPGRIELDFRTLVLPNGPAIPLEAEIASVAGREAVEPSRLESGVVGGAAGGAVLGGAVGGQRGAVIGGVIGVVGATLIASARDHEVVVPSGTKMEITLTAPLEIPAP